MGDFSAGGGPIKNSTNSLHTLRSFAGGGHLFLAVHREDPLFGKLSKGGTDIPVLKTKCRCQLRHSQSTFRFQQLEHPLFGSSLIGIGFSQLSKLIHHGLRTPCFLNKALPLQPAKSLVTLADFKRQFINKPFSRNFFSRLHMPEGLDFKRVQAFYVDIHCLSPCVSSKNCFYNW